jgi:PKD repeat protein
MRRTTRGRRTTIFVAAAVAVTTAATPALAALPDTNTPTLSLDRTIRTVPFAGSTLSPRDAEGLAFVPNRPGHPNIGGTDSMWMVDDNTDSAWEFDPSTGALKSRITDWDATRRYDPLTGTGTGATAGSSRDPDLESLAYDQATDTLYAFSGNCCSGSVLPTAYRLKRGGDGTFHPESWQPLSADSSYTASAWNPVDGKLYVGYRSDLRTYDYPTNTPGAAFRIPNLSGVLGFGFSDDGADLFAVTSSEDLYRVTWATRTIRSGWAFDLTPFGVQDSRGVELIRDEIYVLDGYDGRSTSSPLKNAVFVFDVCCGASTAPTASFTSSAAASPPRTIQFTDTSTGGPTAWAWNFGDGSTATTKNPTHTYAAAGDYTVTLVASNAAGSSSPVSKTVSVTVPPAPTASFTWSAVASPPLTVQLTDTSTGSPTAWAWNFGDGSNATTKNPTHTYAAAGDYTVTLVASNATGPSSPVSTTVSVTVPPVPTAAFTWSAGASPPLTVQFTDTSTGSPTAWAWNFGDGSNATTKNPTHTFAAAGDYTVTLVASNATGPSSPVSKTVTVSPPPPPPSSLTVNPIADSYVSNESPTKNYGSAASLKTKLSDTKEYRTYLSFAVTGLQGKSVSAAQLRLFVTDNGGGGGVHTVANAWTETGTGAITWNNAPALSQSSVAPVGVGVAGTWLTVDLTGVVTGEGTYRLALKTDKSNTVYYDSKEGGQPPQLVLTLQ